MMSDVPSVVKRRERERKFVEFDKKDHLCMYVVVGEQLTDHFHTSFSFDATISKF